MKHKQTGYLSWTGRKLFFIFFILFTASCKKDLPPPVPGAITGQKNLCPADSGITYSIAPVEGSDYYLWTVPDDASIISGQGTTSIVIKFGNKSGQICVRSNNKKEVSEAACLDISQGGISNHWCREKDFKGGGRTEGVGFSIGSKGYMGTGHDGTSSMYRDFWQYDPASNTWTQMADFGGTKRFDAVGFSIGNKGYIGTGYVTTGFLKDFWEFDPTLDKWTQKADCGDTARAFAFGFSIGNKGYVGSGGDGLFQTRRDLLEYDPATDHWVKKANLSVKSNGGSSFSIGNKGYLFRGSDGSLYHTDFWEYNPADSSLGFDINHHPLGKWTQKANFPGPIRYAAAGFSIGDTGYFGTGTDGTNYYKDFFEYNPASDSWLQKSDFEGEGREFSFGFAIGKNGYIGAGNKINSVVFNDFWVYGQ